MSCRGMHSLICGLRNMACVHYIPIYVCMTTKVYWVIHFSILKTKHMIQFNSHINMSQQRTAYQSKIPIFNANKLFRKKIYWCFVTKCAFFRVHNCYRFPTRTPHCCAHGWMHIITSPALTTRFLYAIGVAAHPGQPGINEQNQTSTDGKRSIRAQVTCCLSRHMHHITYVSHTTGSFSLSAFSVEWSCDRVHSGAEFIQSIYYLDLKRRARIDKLLSLLIALCVLSDTDDAVSGLFFNVRVVLRMPN